MQFSKQKTVYGRRARTLSTHTLALICVMTSQFVVFFWYMDFGTYGMQVTSWFLFLFSCVVWLLYNFRKFYFMSTEYNCIHAISKMWHKAKAADLDAMVRPDATAAAAAAEQPFLPHFLVRHLFRSLRV